MSLQSDLQAAVAKVTADSATLHQIVHGDAATTVTTESGPVKSVAKAISDNEAAIAASRAELDLKVAEAAASAEAAQVAKIEWKGAWSGATAYAIRDAVGEAGSSYICIQAHTSQPPPNATYWEVLAAKGNTGDMGVPGPQGPQGDPGTGDLLAGNNLADVADAATAFANIKQAATESASGVLEIATQAEIDAGTDDLRVVTPLKLNTRLASLVAGDDWARNNLMLNWLADEIAHAVSMGSMQDGAHDAFESDTIGTASTNETYDAAGDYYHNPAFTNSLVSGATGTAFWINGHGSYTAAKAFDGSTVNPGYVTYGVTNATPLTVGKDWGSGTSKTISKYVLKSLGPSNTNFSGNNGSTIDIQFFGSNSLPVNATDGTKLHERLNITNTPNAYLEEIVTTGITTSTAYRYHWVNLHSTQGEKSLGEIEFYETQIAADMTLISNAATAQAAPADIRLIVLHDPVDSVTLNTDVKAWASRDGGTTWTQIALTNEGAWDASYNILIGTTDISGQSSGTSMKWKITTHNNKEQRVKAVALAWG